MNHHPPAAAARPDYFYLDMPGAAARSLAVGWLLLALGALVGGGLMTIVIVLSRTPFIQDYVPWVGIFHTALVVHVDLTAVVWFLAVAGMLWCINGSGQWRGVGFGALGTCAAGTVLITLSPFAGSGDALMTNYVPVIDDAVFLTGLGLFAAGFAALVVHSLATSRPIGRTISGQGALRFGLFSALLAALVALGAFAASYLGLGGVIEGEADFEVLFWGGGHALQFVHVQLMLVSWLWLATVSGFAAPLSPRVVLVLFAIGLVPVVLTPAAYLAFAVDTPDHLHTMTWLMRAGGGLAAVPISLVVLYSMARRPRHAAWWGPAHSALLVSMMLFGAGGLVGFLISGSDVTVPAHYHGSIVAVTVAYMGVTVHVLPLLGFARPAGRWVAAQPWLYGGGQLLHVAGLAWSGGYGVERKIAGEAQMLDSVERVLGMALMGIGGLVSVIGGIVFLVIVLRAISPLRRLRPALARARASCARWPRMKAMPGPE